MKCVPLSLLILLPAESAMSNDILFHQLMNAEGFVLNSITNEKFINDKEITCKTTGVKGCQDVQVLVKIETSTFTENHSTFSYQKWDIHCDINSPHMYIYTTPNKDGVIERFEPAKPQVESRILKATNFPTKSRFDNASHYDEAYPVASGETHI
jgi:hypothetical protein